MLRKADVPVPQPSKEETVNVPELGGDVLVRGFLMRDRLEMATTEGYARMAAMLSASVLVAEDDGQTMVPLVTPKQWELWGVKHYAAALNLWDVCRRVSDLEGDDASKKSDAQSSESPAA